jgi:flagellar hook assembly protein FlgD
MENVDIDPDTGEPYSWSVFAASFLKKSLIDVKTNPRVFSPDGDGICDYTVIEFTASKLDIPRDVEIQIFDLNGNVVRDLVKESVVAGQYTGLFSSPEDAVGYWDGTDDDGDLLPPGVYIYRVELKLSGGSEISTGTVTMSY